MLVVVAERLRAATTLAAIAQAIVEELAALAGVRSSALVLLDVQGAPSLWIGDARIDRDEILAYLDAGDAAITRVCRTQVPELAGDAWLGPLHGTERVIGVLRVALDREVDGGTLTTVAAHVSIRIAHLGLVVDDPRSLEALTPRQREVAELVAHGCTNPEIASMFAISANAVKKHVSRVLAALEVSNRTELAALTSRWQSPSGNHQILPPSVQRVARKQLKSLSPGDDEEGA
jgi:DNA-binding CsgD family transcriptional regulator